MLENVDCTVLDSKGFKEDSVREDIIMPVLAKLGFTHTGDKTIARSPKLSRPFVSVGSTRKQIHHYPDYVLMHKGKAVLVLDAKSPKGDIREGKHVEQVYYYSIHPDIRCSYALCNGKEWTFFRQVDTKPHLIIATKDIEGKWKELYAFLFPDASSEPDIDISKKGDDYYLSLKPPEVIEKPKKQSKKRHFGVHGYFTKQSWDIVDRHIDNFTQLGDKVLDSYGGTGVTLTEALMRGRKGVHIDLNPLSIFWMKTLLSKVNLHALENEGKRIVKQFQKEISKTTLKEVQDVLPENVPVLARGSDAQYLHDFFSHQQLLELGLLKQLIAKAKTKALRHNLMLAFSSTVTKANLTYHNSKSRDENAGNSGIFIYYSYKRAPRPVYVDIGKSFTNKLRNLIKAKEELKHIRATNLEESSILKGDATNLTSIPSESIDYIYTDPPYGKKIEYLGLSVMWNAWLDLKVTKADYQKEAIEGGHLKRDRDTYGQMITRSIEEMFRVLKWNRWMSFVFQHQDPYYWHLVVESAEKAGFEYKGITRQNNGQTSFKKRKNPFSVLSGQLIIHFLKKESPRARMKADLSVTIEDLIANDIEAVIAANISKGGATINDINDSLIINGLELGFLDTLKAYGDLIPYLNNNFTYKHETERYTLRPNTQFKTKVPVKVRIQYFLISYLKRENGQGNYPKFDDIILHVMPLLQNGKTPENQTIKGVLSTLASPYEGGYLLKEISSSDQMKWNV